MHESNFWAARKRPSQTQRLIWISASLEAEREKVEQWEEMLEKKFRNKFEEAKKIEIDFEPKKSIRRPTVWFDFTSEANLNELLIKMKLKNDHSIAFH